MKTTRSKSSKKVLTTLEKEWKCKIFSNEGNREKEEIDLKKLNFQNLKTQLENIQAENRKLRKQEKSFFKM